MMTEPDDAVAELDAPEIMALVRGAVRILARYQAMSSREAQRELALFGVTHHEVSADGSKWTHVPMRPDTQR